MRHVVDVLSINFPLHYEVQPILRARNRLSVFVGHVLEVDSVYQQTTQTVDIIFALRPVHTDYRGECPDVLVLLLLIQLRLLQRCSP